MGDPSSEYKDAVTICYNIKFKMNQDPKDFTVHEYGVVSQSKKEVYGFLAVEGGYDLPPIE